MRNDGHGHWPAQPLASLPLHRSRFTLQATTAGTKGLRSFACTFFPLCQRAAAPTAPLTLQLPRDAFLSGYRSCYHERSYWIDDSMVEGNIPPELEGTLLRNGPGLFEVGGKKVR